MTDRPQAPPDLVLAARRQRPSRTPVWFMRQAGRSLPEYRRVREGVAMLDSCRRPDLVTEITLQPVRRYGVDAAIFYSDIVVPLAAAGVDLDIKPGVGPVVAEPIRTRADLDRLPPLTPDAVPYVTQAVQQIVAELGSTPLIGFAGAPFTLASYLVEGGPSRDLHRTKALMLGDPALWRDLLDRLAQISRTFLQVQVEAGAAAVQLFDSWVGALSLADYVDHVQPSSAAVLEPLAALGVPRIHFGVGTGELLAAMGRAGADVVGVDFRLSLADAARRVGPGYALQGNLDPAALFAPRAVLRDRVLAVLAAARDVPGHIFNLGHGVPPDADPGALAHVVDLVHEHGASVTEAVTSGGDERPLVVVVGAGVSGLTAAWRLATGPRPPRVIVLEQSPRVGGKLLVGELGGHELDLGAESVLARRPEAVDLLHEVGFAGDVVHPAAAGASVVRDGRLHALPAGTVMGVPGRPDRLAGLLTPAEVERVAAEPALAPTPVGDDVDVASYVTARVGRAVVDRLVEPLLGGVYAGSADRLSLRATVPQLWQQARAGGSLLEGVRTVTEPVTPPGGGEWEATAPRPVFAGLRGGLGRLPLRLAERLAASGVEVRTGATVRELRRTTTGWLVVAGPVPAPVAVPADAVVLAVPPAPAARLLGEAVPAAAAELARIETASVALVAALVPRASLAGLAGTGLLVPPIESRPVKAATYASAKWAWVDELDPRHVVVRASLGRAREEAVLQRDDADLAALALADLADLLGRPLVPAAVRVVRWGGGLPQPAVGHVAAIERVRAAVAGVPRLAVCGAALDGVGIPACVAAASRAASEVVVQLSPG